MPLAVPQRLRERWKSGRHIGAQAGGLGDSRATQRVRVRTGRFFHRYDEFPTDDFAFMPGEGSLPWQAFWTPSSPWQDVEAAASVEEQHSFDNNGIKSITLTIENIKNLDTAGPVGNFIQRIRGYFSPLRGSGLQGNRPGDNQPRNEWYGLLRRNAQIMVEQGYGDITVRTFTGLIDDVDVSSSPDRITLAVRDFGQTLTDQHVFGWIIGPSERGKVTFADRNRQILENHVGGGASASSHEPGYPPRFVSDTDNDTWWLSQSHSSPDVTEYVDVKLPKGRYESFYLYPQFGNMEVYVSVYANKWNPDKDINPSVDGVRVSPGWLNPNATPDVPGAYGGRPYIRKLGGAAKAGRRYRFGHVLDLGDDSTLRIHFRNLQKSNAGGYRAGVKRMFAYKVATVVQSPKGVELGRWILVDDLADVVRVVLRWAGFKEWDVENTGVPLSKPIVFNQQNFCIDIINKMCELTGYIFFIAEPEHDESIGVPTFRRSRVLIPVDAIEQVKDTDILTGIKVHETDEPLASIIRVRGRTRTAAQGGVELGGDTRHMVQFTYRPPWHINNRMGGLLKHVIHYEALLKNLDECEAACLLIAFQEAMKASIAVIEIPAYPGIQIDDIISVVDASSGVSTRIWVGDKRVTCDGNTGKYYMTIQGSLLDTPDCLEVLQELRSVGAGKAGEELVPEILR